MLLHVLHETAYDYAPPVKTAHHMAHLRPLDDARQQLLQHALRVEPAPTALVEQPDAFGNIRVCFDLPTPHDALRVAADSLVQTQPPPTTDNPIAWDSARERLRYHREARYDPAAEFVFASPYVPRHQDFLAYAQPSFAPGRPLQAAAHELMARIHADFAYVPAATDVSTPALQALALRQGVCQDFAHVMTGCLRSLGLAARYVSGYLLTEPPPGQPRLVGSDASHAWVSVYLPEQDPQGARGGHWCEFDPTNNRAPGEDYVILAIGRDYSDVSPIRGVIQGGTHHALKVAVTVTPVDAAAVAQRP